jgi:hypothetical protein
MKTTVRFTTIFALTLASGLALTHVAAQTPQPSAADVQKLQRFVGTWNGKGDMKASDFGPAGTMTWTETCEWFEGKHHVICHSTGKGPTGEVKGLSIMGFDPAAKAYTFYGVDNQGWSDFSTGTLSGKTWTFTSRNNSRFSLTEVSDTKHTFNWEIAPDGKTWTTIMTGEASK